MKRYSPSLSVPRETRARSYLANGREFYPQALTGAVRVLRDEYGVTVPVNVTENGYCDRNETPVDGRVHDAGRITYLTGFLGEALHSATDLNIRGYYAWSLMDNYEWAAAYTERFGLIRVDAAGIRRVWKDSAYWFQRLCATRTLSVDE